MIKSKRDLKICLEQDSSNYPPPKGFVKNIKNVLFASPGSVQVIQWKYLYYLRKAEYAINTHQRIKKVLYLFLLRHYAYKTGFQIPPNVLEPGVTFYHWGMIIIHGSAKIGKNSSFQPNVVIGKNKKEGGAPIIGDNFYACAGARIYGDITIGNNVRVGPNCCLYKSVPDNCVVVGNPAIIIKKDGEKCHIQL